MRLRHYITEDTDHDVRVLKHIVSRECKPFLKEFGMEYKHDRVIWRGAKQYPNNINRVKTRKDRRARFNVHLHKYLSKISKQIFGWDIRTEGVFTGGSNVASPYGKKYIFIPIGKYRYVWVDLDMSPIYDLYDYYERNSIGGVKDGVPLEDIEDNIKFEYENNYKTYYLNLASNFEAIFDCKEYLLINADSYHILKMTMMEL